MIDSYEIDLSNLVTIIPMDMNKNIYSDFRGWMSPDGELHSLYGVDGHTKLAREVLGYYPKDPIKALSDKGWTRIVCANSFSCARLDDNTRHLLLGIVLKKRDCAKFFIDIDKQYMEFTRDEAIGYLGDRI